MNRSCWIACLAVVAFVIAGCDRERARPAASSADPTSLLTAGVVVSPAEVNEALLQQWSGHRIALWLEGGESAAAEKTAAELIQRSRGELDYFIEIGRCPELADSHPEWMASLQGHDEWRRLFPDAPEPDARQVIKNYPWVPILYRESSAAHLQRVADLLRDLPAPRRIWLNDLQGAPSACGCGHPLCRWTADYGPIKTATPLGDDAAAKFVKEVTQLSPGCEVVPIFVGECELDDRDTVCCGVACYEGICWKAFSRQLDALAQSAPLIGTGCFYHEFSRDLDRYQGEAGWVQVTLRSFSEMPPKRQGTGVPAERLIAVLQGWDVNPQQLQAQIDQASAAGASGYLIVLPRVEQSWQPRLFDLPADLVVPESDDSHDHH